MVQNHRKYDWIKTSPVIDSKWSFLFWVKKQKKRGWLLEDRPTFYNYEQLCKLLRKHTSDRLDYF